MSSAQTVPPIVVLDTNVVLDWVVFRNPDCTALVSAIVAGRLRWAATPAMRDELAHVLGRGHLDAWKPDSAALWSLWAHHCEEMPPPSPRVSAGRLRCTDPDDQKFIDLAVDAGAEWLISRDRAVLKLARRLRECGVTTILPGDWLPLTPAD